METMGGRPLTEAGFRAVARKFRLLSDPARLRILFLLQRGRASVGEIAEQLDLSQPTASRHLAKLSDGGILRREPEGPVVFYSVADPSVVSLCEGVCGALNRPAEPLFLDE